MGSVEPEGWVKTFAGDSSAIKINCLLSADVAFFCRAPKLKSVLEKNKI